MLHMNKLLTYKVDFRYLSILVIFSIKALYPMSELSDSSNAEISIKISPEDGPALVNVESERHKDGLHAIYWDGESVYDPNPYTKDGRPLSSYKINCWVPIRKAQRNRCISAELYNSIQPSKKKKNKKIRKG